VKLDGDDRPEKVVYGLDTGPFEREGALEAEIKR